MPPIIYSSSPPGITALLQLSALFESRATGKPVDAVCSLEQELHDVVHALAHVSQRLVQPHQEPLNERCTHAWQTILDASLYLNACIEQRSQLAQLSAR